MTHLQEAEQYFKKGYACSQAVLMAYCKDLNLDKGIALGIASGFGGGMGGMAETCGALTGAFMVISLRYGGALEQKKIIYEKVQLVAQKFKNRNNGYCACRDLLGADLSTEEGKEFIVKKKLFQTSCPQFVKDAIDILEEVESEQDTSKI